MKTAPQLLLATLLAAGFAAAFAGCKSPNKPYSASFASVEIQGHTPLEIRAATLSVFEQAGYSAVDFKPSEIAFEKEGSQWDRIAYGNWIDGNPVWYRVNVMLIPLSQGAFLLQCQAFKVRDKGDPIFEQQVRLRNSKSKPYQTLLNQVRARLTP